MKILHVYKDFYPPIHGGIEGHIAHLCAIQRQWAETEALVCSRTWRTRQAQRSGTLVTEVGEWGRFQSAPLAPAFPLRLRATGADVIVIHVPNPTAELSALMLPPKGVIVVRYHSDVVRQRAAMKVYEPFMMRFLRKAAIILPTSERYIETSPILTRLREHCRAVPLGIRPEAFSSCDPERVRALQQQYGGKYVLFAGRHRYYKGLEFLVRAAPQIDAPVVIIGDGPERPTLQAMARDLNVNIHFPGTVSDDDLVAHLHGCAVFAFPSILRSEAFGLSILEAHAAGKPVVATKLGTGVEFANLDGVTGINVPPRDPGALAEAVNTLLRDEAKAHEIGERARERVHNDFDIRNTARLEFDAYMEALECNKPGS